MIIKKLKATITIEVWIDTNGTLAEEIKDQLNGIPEYIAGNGMLTGELPATVDTWKSEVLLKVIK